MKVIRTLLFQISCWSFPFIPSNILSTLHFSSSPPLGSLLLSNILLSASSRGSQYFSLIDWFCQTPMSTIQGQDWELDCVCASNSVYQLLFPYMYLSNYVCVRSQHITLLCLPTRDYPPSTKSFFCLEMKYFKSIYDFYLICFFSVSRKIKQNHSSNN